MNRHTGLAAEDFYLEDGKFVFTAAYHRKRGWCCGQGCRHCPFRGEQAAKAQLAPPGITDEGVPDGSPGAN